jgi:tetratricopeptide (TPR) repeat protein
MRKEWMMAKTPVQIERPPSIESLQEELKRNPKVVKNYLHLGWTYYVQGSYDQASQILSDAKDRFPEDVEVLYALALALKKNGDTDAALRFFRKVTLLAEKMEDRTKSGMLRRLAIGHANVITEGDWNLSHETWESK